MRKIVVRLVWLLALAAAVGVAACDSGNSVRGDVVFHRDVDLPEGAVVTVKLLDTSLADAAAVELGRDVITGAQRLPLSFSIAYDPDKIVERREYTLLARIELNGQLLYINDTVHQVLTSGYPRERDVQVIAVEPYEE